MSQLVWHFARTGWTGHLELIYVAICPTSWLQWLLPLYHVCPTYWLSLTFRAILLLHLHYQPEFDQWWCPVVFGYKSEMFVARISLPLQHLQSKTQHHVIHTQLQAQHTASVSDEVMDPVILVIFDDIYTYNTRFISRVTLTELSRRQFQSDIRCCIQKTYAPVDLACLVWSSS